MPAVPPHVSRAALGAELPAAEALAARAGWRVEWDPDALVLTLQLMHPKLNCHLRLTANCTDYRAVPPAWRFVDPATGDDSKSAWPLGGPVDGVASIFHGQPVLCAPFNRLAYKTLGGPHGDWVSPEAWLSVSASNMVRATTLGEMLQIIRVHLLCSPGMMT